MSFPVVQLDSNEECVDFDMNNCVLTGEDGAQRSILCDKTPQLRTCQPEWIWISCSTCFMSMFLDHNNMRCSTQTNFIGYHCSTVVKCLKCLEIESLSNEISHLKHIVEVQKERICKLKEINTLENELDSTFNDIINGVAALEIKDDDVELEKGVVHKDKYTVDKSMQAEFSGYNKKGFRLPIPPKF